MQSVGQVETPKAKLLFGLFLICRNKNAALQLLNFAAPQDALRSI